jgi:hypothetical protein
VRRRVVLKLAGSTEKKWNVFKQIGKFCVQKFWVNVSRLPCRKFKRSYPLPKEGS